MILKIRKKILVLAFLFLFQLILLNKMELIRRQNHDLANGNGLEKIKSKILPVNRSSLRTVQGEQLIGKIFIDCSMRSRVLKEYLIPPDKLKDKNKFKILNFIRSTPRNKRKYLYNQKTGSIKRTPRGSREFSFFILAHLHGRSQRRAGLEIVLPENHLSRRLIAQIEHALVDKNFINIGQFASILSLSAFEFSRRHFINSSAGMSAQFHQICPISTSKSLRKISRLIRVPSCLGKRGNGKDGISRNQRLIIIRIRQRTVLADTIFYFQARNWRASAKIFKLFNLTESIKSYASGGSGTRFLTISISHNQFTADSRISSCNRLSFFGCKSGLQKRPIFFFYFSIHLEKLIQSEAIGSFLGFWSPVSRFGIVTPVNGLSWTNKIFSLGSFHKRDTGRRPFSRLPISIKRGRKRAVQAGVARERDNIRTSSMLIISPEAAHPSHRGISSFCPNLVRLFLQMFFNRFPEFFQVRVRHIPKRLAKNFLTIISGKPNLMQSRASFNGSNSFGFPDPIKRHHEFGIQIINIRKIGWRNDITNRVGSDKKLAKIFGIAPNGLLWRAGVKIEFFGYDRKRLKKISNRKKNFYFRFLKKNREKIRFLKLQNKYKTFRFLKLQNNNIQDGGRDYSYQNQVCFREKKARKISHTKIINKKFMVFEIIPEAQTFPKTRKSETLPTPRRGSISWPFWDSCKIIENRPNSMGSAQRSLWKVSGAPQNFWTTSKLSNGTNRTQYSSGAEVSGLISSLEISNKNFELQAKLSNPNFRQEKIKKFEINEDEGLQMNSCIFLTEKQEELTHKAGPKLPLGTEVCTQPTCDCIRDSNSGHRFEFSGCEWALKNLYKMPKNLSLTHDRRQRSDGLDRFPDTLSDNSKFSWRPKSTNSSEPHFQNFCKNKIFNLSRKFYSKKDIFELAQKTCSERHQWQKISLDRYRTRKKIRLKITDTGLEKKIRSRGAKNNGSDKTIMAKTGHKNFILKKSQSGLKNIYQPVRKKSEKKFFNYFSHRAQVKYSRAASSQPAAGARNLHISFRIASEEQPDSSFFFGRETAVKIRRCLPFWRRDSRRLKIRITTQEKFKNFEKYKIFKNFCFLGPEGLKSKFTHECFSQADGEVSDGAERANVRALGALELKNHSARDVSARLDHALAVENATITLEKKFLNFSNKNSKNQILRNYRVKNLKNTKKQIFQTHRNSSSSSAVIAPDLQFETSQHATNGFRDAILKKSIFNPENDFWSFAQNLKIYKKVKTFYFKFEKKLFENKFSIKNFKKTYSRYLTAVSIPRSDTHTSAKRVVSLAGAVKVGARAIEFDHIWHGRGRLKNIFEHGAKHRDGLGLAKRVKVQRRTISSGFTAARNEVGFEQALKQKFENLASSSENWPKQISAQLSGPDSKTFNRLKNSKSSPQNRKKSNSCKLFQALKNFQTPKKSVKPKLTEILGPENPEIQKKQEIHRFQAPKKLTRPKPVKISGPERLTIGESKCCPGTGCTAPRPGKRGTGDESITRCQCCERRQRPLIYSIPVRSLNHQNNKFLKIFKNLKNEILNFQKLKKNTHLKPASNSSIRDENSQIENPPCWRISADHSRKDRFTFPARAKGSPGTYLKNSKIKRKISKIFSQSESRKSKMKIFGQSESKKLKLKIYSLRELGNRAKFVPPALQNWTPIFNILITHVSAVNSHLHSAFPIGIERQFGRIPIPGELEIVLSTDTHGSLKFKNQKNLRLKAYSGQNVGVIKLHENFRIKNLKRKKFRKFCSGQNVGVIKLLQNFSGQNVGVIKHWELRGEKSEKISKNFEFNSKNRNKNLKKFSNLSEISGLECRSGLGRGENPNEREVKKVRVGSEKRARHLSSPESASADWSTAKTPPKCAQVHPRTHTPHPRLHTHKPPPRESVGLKNFENLKISKISKISKKSRKSQNPKNSQKMEKRPELAMNCVIQLQKGFLQGAENPETVRTKLINSGKIENNGIQDKLLREAMVWNESLDHVQIGLQSRDDIEILTQVEKFVGASLNNQKDERVTAMGKTFIRPKIIFQLIFSAITGRWAVLAKHNTQKLEVLDRSTYIWDYMGDENADAVNQAIQEFENNEQEPEVENQDVLQVHIDQNEKISEEEVSPPSLSEISKNDSDVSLKIQINNREKRSYTRSRSRSNPRNFEIVREKTKSKSREPAKRERKNKRREKSRSPSRERSRTVRHTPRKKEKPARRVYHRQSSSSSSSEHVRTSRKNRSPSREVFRRPRCSTDSSNERDRDRNRDRARDRNRSNKKHSKIAWESSSSSSSGNSSRNPKKRFRR